VFLQVRILYSGPLRHLGNNSARVILYLHQRHRYMATTLITL
jgi:hypothetical protein